MPSGTSIIRVNPAAARRALICFDLPPRAQMRAMGWPRLLLTNRRSLAVKAGSSIDKGRAEAAIPVCRHSPGVRISTNKTFPFAADFAAALAVIVVFGRAQTGAAPAEARTMAMARAMLLRVIPDAIDDNVRPISAAFRGRVCVSIRRPHIYWPRTS